MKKYILVLVVFIGMVGFAHAEFETTTNNPNPIFTGTNATSTIIQSYTLKFADVFGFTTISMTPNTGNLTITLPASSTMGSWLPYAGNVTTFYLFNSTSTANIGIGLIPGTGSLIQYASTTATTTTQKYSLITVMRKPNTDFLFTVTPTY